MREVKLNKEQFLIFNDYDQFQLFTDDDGFPNFEDFDAEVDKLFLLYDYIVVNEDDYIYGEKNGKRILLAQDSTEAFTIALEVLEDLD
jgi:hypothetical protein